MSWKQSPQLLWASSNSTVGTKQTWEAGGGRLESPCQGIDRKAATARGRKPEGNVGQGREERGARGRMRRGAGRGGRRSKTAGVERAPEIG